MRCSPEELRTLGPLLMSGSAEKLRSRMCKIWPPDTPWDDEDIKFVTLLLRTFKSAHPGKADPLYIPFAGRIKNDTGEPRWLRTLFLRAEVIKVYEGYDKAIAWLQEMAQRILPPDDGVVHLVMGKLMLSQGELVTARDELRRAVERSMHGLEWYSLEALKEMSLCQVRLGNQLLAFEYAKTYLTQSYKLCKISADQMLQACKGQAIIFGQIDYLFELLGNLTQKAREEGNFRLAAVTAGEAAVLLCQIGAANEATDLLQHAAADSERMPDRIDAQFAMTCRLLARYVDPTPLAREELNHTLSEFAMRWGQGANRALIDTTRERLCDDAPLDSHCLEEWRAACIEYRQGFGTRRDETMEILVHLAALVARFYDELGTKQVATALYNAVLEGDGEDSIGTCAIFPLVRERLAQILMQAGEIVEALQICERPLMHEIISPLNRFVFRQLVSQCKLLLGHTEEAFEGAIAALADWKRILEGLYDEKHKIAWLSRGENCLKCAIDAIRKPVGWMTNEERHRQLFRLMEFGKARIVTDMMSRRSYLPGSYMLADILRHGAEWDKVMFQIVEEDPDWYAPLVLEIPVLMDQMSTVIHEDDGRIAEVVPVDLAPFRCALQMPLSPEKRLLVTAESLAFEESDVPVSQELYEDLLLWLTPDKKEGGYGF